LINLKNCFISSKNEIFVLTDDYTCLYYLKNIESQPVILSSNYTSGIYQLIEFKGEILAGSNSGIARFDGTTLTSYMPFYVSVWALYPQGDSLWVGSENGLGIYSNNIYKPYARDIFTDDVNAIIGDKNPSRLWIGKNNGLFLYDTKLNKIVHSMSMEDGLTGNEVSINGFYIDKKDKLWIGSFHGVTNIKLLDNYRKKFIPLVQLKIYVNDIQVDSLPSELAYNQNNIQFEITGLSFKNEFAIRYDFRLEGLNNNKIDSTGKEYKANYTLLPPGEYQFVYRVKGVDDIWSDYQRIKFSISRPFWFTWWFYIILVLYVGICIRIYLIMNTQKIQKQKQILENLVVQRTKELNKQREEVMLQKNELMLQKEEIQAQNDKLADYNKELEKLAFIVSKTDNSVIIADADGTIEWVNDGFRRILGLSLDEFKYQHGSNIFNTSLNSDLRNVVAECVQNNHSTTYNSKTKTTDGKIIHIQTTLTPIIDDKGKLSKIIAIDTDVSKIKYAEEKIYKQNKDITDSIHYARYIQNALMPSIDQISKLFPETFLFYKPRDIVSGDFYYLWQNNKNIIIAVADCTGHGVPGALMSMLGISFLNEIIVKNEKVKPSDVLNQLTDYIINFLNKKGADEDVKDGMDISICMIDNETNKLLYAAANSSIYLVRKIDIDIPESIPENETSNEKYKLITLKGNRMPVGLYVTQRRSFTNQAVDLVEGDSLYLLTDGFVDQVGGPRGRKFLSKNLKNVLLSIQDKKMSEQKIIIEDCFDNWKSSYFQIDDVLVLGMKIAMTFNTTPKSSQRYNWKGKSILMAEDIDFNYKITEALLLNTGVELLWAKNGQEAVEKYLSVEENRKFDIILMDVQMPVMDGLEATYFIRKQDKDIPIVIFSSFTFSDEREKCILAGCTDFVNKPIEEDNFFSTLEKYL
jgi:PAS domain S-box-containing protein